MDNVNTNLVNLINSYKKTGQSDEVIKQSLWQLGFIPELIESHLDYCNKHTSTVNNDTKTVKNNKDMKLTLEKLHVSANKAISSLEEMKSDNSLGFSASAAKSIIENCMAQLQITKDDEMVLQEKIKMGYKIDDTLVNPVIKYAVAENLHYSLIQYDWLKPVADLREMIGECFVGDKWSFTAARFARSIANQTTNEAFNNLYEHIIDTLIDEENTRLALKTVLIENAWNSGAKKILAEIIAEEKSEMGEVDERIYENSQCSFQKNISPLLIDGETRIFNLNGKNYAFDGKQISEVRVTDTKYLNVLEGLKLFKYESDKDRLVYYGKNDMILEYNCTDDTIKLTGMDDINDKSIIDIYETLKRCGIFNRETISHCVPIVRLLESKDILTEIDTITTIKSDKFPGVFVSVINVNEGVYVNKVNQNFNMNEMVLCESAKEACQVIKDFIKYDATTILEAKLKEEGEQNAIIESERNEIKDNLSFLNEKRNELISAIQETNNSEKLLEALKLIESEIHKFEKKLQESYEKKK
ncbi:MAG: hypothetical protein NC548_30975 [Lachnospiraceae bacterium]|nr:hypothetical protein [Lachnospiraceae bacterium]